MTTPDKPSQAPIVAAGGLSGLILLFWIAQLPGLSSMGGSDAAGNAISQALAALSVGALWLALAVLMLLACAKGEMPKAAAVAALVLVPASGVAAFMAADLLATPHLAPFRWPILIPALVPPLIVAFSLWALLPPLRKAIPAPIAAGVTWGATLLLCLAMFPMQQARQRVVGDIIAKREKADAAYAALPADAPLWDLAPFLDAPNQITVNAVVDRMRARANRQSEAETMLARGDFPLRYLGRIDLDPTPVVCEKARALLRQRAASLASPKPGTEPYLKIFGEVNDAIAAMRWLVGYDCSCNDESLAWEATANSYRDPGYDLVELKQLRDPKELGRTLRENPERFSMLSEKSHLKAWLHFADDKALRDQALAGARKLDHRNADAVEMLNNKYDIAAPWTVLKYIPELDLEPTPALCTAGLAQIRNDLAKVYRPTAADPRPYRELLDRLGAYQPLTALQWLAGHGCNAEPELTEAETVIRTYQDSAGRTAMLEALGRLHTGRTP